MIELRGAPVAEAIRKQAASAIRDLPRPPQLVSILDPTAEDAAQYSRQQRRACERVGIEFVEHAINDDAPELIARLNADPSVSAVFVHEPAPTGLSELVDPSKDPERPVPCTAEAVMAMLDHYGVELDGAHVVVVGRGTTVGRPLLSLLLDRRPGPTITVCHTGTKDLAGFTKSGDIVIAAAGQPGLVDAVADGAVVIDVGTNVQDGELVGDVDRAAIEANCQALSPVPGGVGPVTVACLLRSVIRAAGGPVT